MESCSSGRSPTEARSNRRSSISHRKKRSLHSYLFESGGESITAYGGPALSLHCGDEARLEGYRVGNVMLVTAAAVERSAEPAAECRTDGAQRLAVILANFPALRSGAHESSNRRADLRTRQGDTVSNFYKEASYGALNLTGDVFGWYTLDREYKCGEYAQLRVAALKAADTDVDFTRYSRSQWLSIPALTPARLWDKERLAVKLSFLRASVRKPRTHRCASPTPKICYLQSSTNSDTILGSNMRELCAFREPQSDPTAASRPLRSTVISSP